MSSVCVCVVSLAQYYIYDIFSSCCLELQTIILIAVFHCVTIFIYPLYCWQTFVLFLSLGYNEQHCYEYPSAHISVGYTPRRGTAGELPHMFSKWLYQATPSPTVFDDCSMFPLELATQCLFILCQRIVYNFIACSTEQGYPLATRASGTCRLKAENPVLLTRWEQT